MWVGVMGCFWLCVVVYFMYDFGVFVLCDVFLC